MQCQNGIASCFSCMHFEIKRNARNECLWNFDELLSMTWEYCNMIRIYTKPKGAIGCCVTFFTILGLFLPKYDF